MTNLHSPFGSALLQYIRSAGRGAVLAKAQAYFADWPERPEWAERVKAVTEDEFAHAVGLAFAATPQDRSRVQQRRRDKVRAERDAAEPADEDKGRQWLCSRFGRALLAYLKRAGPDATQERAARHFADVLQHGHADRTARLTPDEFAHARAWSQATTREEKDRIKYRRYTAKKQAALHRPSTTEDPPMPGLRQNGPGIAPHAPTIAPEDAGAAPPEPLSPGAFKAVPRAYTPPEELPELAGDERALAEEAGERLKDHVDPVTRFMVAVALVGGTVRARLLLNHLEDIALLLGGPKG